MNWSGILIFKEFHGIRCLSTPPDMWRTPVEIFVYIIGLAMSFDGSLTSFSHHQMSHKHVKEMITELSNKNFICVI